MDYILPFLVAVVLVVVFLPFDILKMCAKYSLLWVRKLTG